MKIDAYARISSGLLPFVMFVALVAIVMGGFGLTHTTQLAGPASFASNAVIHWRDASHDWLLVGDGATDQLSIYNAIDGSLVRRVSVKRGLHDANSFAQRDGRLFVVGDDGKLGELKLPQLQMVASTKP